MANKRCGSLTSIPKKWIAPPTPVIKPLGTEGETPSRSALPEMRAEWRGGTEYDRTGLGGLN